MKYLALSRLINDDGGISSQLDQFCTNLNLLYQIRRILRYIHNAYNIHSTF